MTVPLPQRTLARGRGALHRPRRPEPRPPGRRLPLNEATRPYAGELLRTLLAVLAADSEEAGLVALRTAFEINKAFRAHLEEHVPAFLEVVRKVGPPRASPGAARACRGNICRRWPRGHALDLGPGAWDMPHALRRSLPRRPGRVQRAAQPGGGGAHVLLEREPGRRRRPTRARRSRSAPASRPARTRPGLRRRRRPSRSWSRCRCRVRSLARARPRRRPRRASAPAQRPARQAGRRPRPAGSAGMRVRQGRYAGTRVRPSGA